MSSVRRRATTGWRARPSLLIPPPITAAARPIPIAQKNSATVGVVNVGMSGTASENVPNPVSLSKPRKMSDPTPAARRPGTNTTPSIGPAIPETSISRNAPAKGEPKRVLTAAKLPAAAIINTACVGAPFLMRCIARTPSPLPIAISGASGPSTTPRLRVANAAMTMPGRSIGLTGPDALKPSAGS